MEIMEIIELVVALLAGLATCIPLVIKLVQYVEKAKQEKNFGSIMKMVLELMTEAEANYETGAERKEYVMDAIRNISDTLDYPVDMDKVSNMIDAICDASKNINIKTK
jgi:hypothetical protein